MVRQARNASIPAQPEAGQVIHPFTLTAPKKPPSPQDQIIPAITACADAFLNPPIANVGHWGIDKAGKLVRTWIQRTDDPQRDLPQAALLMEKAGTGGALFRNLYRDFLAECVHLLDSGDLRTGHELYPRRPPCGRKPRH
jgi:hypothetical protein